VHQCDARDPRTLGGHERSNENEVSDQRVGGILCKHGRYLVGPVRDPARSESFRGHCAEALWHPTGDDTARAGRDIQGMDLGLAHAYDVAACCAKRATQMLADRQA